MRLSIRFRDWDNTFDRPLQSLIIGRPKPGSAPPDLDLSPDLTVSRPHARLFWESEEWWLEDLGSTHGTQLCGREIRGAGPQKVGAGDTFQIGETLLRPEIAAKTTTDIAANKLEHAENEFSGDAALSDDAAQKLGRLNPLLLRCGTTEDLDELLRELVARVVEVIPSARRGALLLHSRDTDALLLAAFQGEGGPAVSETLARRAMQEKRGFLWEGERQDISSTSVPGASVPNASVPGASIARYAISSALVAPLLWRGEVLGVLCADADEPDAFVPGDLPVMLTVAHHVALALSNRRLSDELRRANALKANLLRQFSPQVRQHLLSMGSLQVSGERSEVTILALDVRGFTGLTRQMEPIAVIELLNDYFSRLTPIIHAHNGTLDKYIGDGILAVFGSPEPDPLQHENALRAALELQAEMARSNLARAKKGKVTCQIGVGVHCGEVLHGFIGVLDQLSLTVIGEAVNRATRFCDGAAGGEIMLSPQIFQWVWKNVEAEATEIVTKHDEKLAAYRLVGIKDSE